jgi:acyl-CoA dehydrogenase
MAPDEGNMHMLGIIATQEQKEQYLSPLAAGDVQSCFGMTEPHPGAGSDPNQLTSNAHYQDGQWVLNGHKRFISGANLASFCIAMMRTEAQDDSPAGATMFLVDMDSPGVRVGEQIHTIDTTISGGHPHVYFDNVVVDESAVLGEVGKGFEYAQVRLGPARLTHCMRWLGLARRSLDIALDRAENREIFGAQMYMKGLVQELIAQCEIDIETSAAIIEKTALKLEEDPKTGQNLSSIAKVYVSEAVYRIIDRCIQICGGDGVSDGLPLAQYLNEVRPFRIYDGSTETHKFAISRRASSRRRKEVQAGAPFQGAAIVRGKEKIGDNI